MKQTKSSEGVKAQVKTVSAKKVFAAFGLVLTAAAIGAVAIYGVSRSNRLETTDSVEAVATTASAVTTAAPEADKEEDVEYSETVTWWKAGVEDYDFAEVTQAETTAATTKKTTAATEGSKTVTTTTAAAKTTKKTTAKKTTVEEISGLKVYATAAVNVRSDADTSSEKLGTLAPDTGVSVTGKTSNGWYRIKYGDKTGYVTAEYFTTDKPAAVTTTAAAAKAAKTTTAATAKAAKKTTTTAAPATTNSGTISYTDEEFEMLCYVLQGEVGNCSEASKIAVANVVINRVKSPYFGSSIKEVLTAPNQFTAIYGYYDGSKVPSQNTRDCALRALNGEDNSNGAVYYYAPQYCGGATAAWFESLTFCLEIDGQRYFK